MMSEMSFRQKLKEELRECRQQEEEEEEEGDDAVMRSSVYVNQLNRKRGVCVYW